MKRLLVVAMLSLVLVSCQEAVEKIPRTTVVVSVGAAGPALQALMNFLPEGLTINLPADWDTLDIETAMMGVLVDAQPCTSATCMVSTYTLPYDTVTGLYLPIDTTGFPMFLTLGAGDSVVVYSPEDTVTGVLPSCPGVVIDAAPDSITMGSDMDLAWHYDAGNPDSVMVSVKIPGREAITEIMSGSITAYTVPGASLDTTGLASVSISSLVFETEMAGATPGSFILYTKSEFAPVVIY